MKRLLVGGFNPRKNLIMNLMNRLNKDHHPIAGWIIQHVSNNQPAIIEPPTTSETNETHKGKQSFRDLGQQRNGRNWEFERTNQNVQTTSKTQCSVN